MVQWDRLTHEERSAWLRRNVRLGGQTEWHFYAQIEVSRRGVSGAATPTRSHPEVPRHRVTHKVTPRRP